MPRLGVFRQVEYAGILAGTRNRELAEKFIDFLLSVPVQEDIPGQMAVYPVNQDAAVPDAFTRFSQVDVEVAEMTPERIADGRQRWIDEWTREVLR